MKIFAANYTQLPPIQRQKTTNISKAVNRMYFNTICFKGQDFLDLPEEEIYKRIMQSVNAENFLGQGTEAEVYRIKDTGYCVRIPYLAADVFCTNYSKELTQIDKLNHVAAKLGFGASIMKYFEGIIPKWFKDNNISRYDLQGKIAEMPVKSYSELLHQIADAIDNDMLFDFSGGNLIVDTENKKLTAIDFYGMSDNPRPTKPLCEMYSILTCYGCEKETGKKIFDKIVLAGLEEFKPGVIPCMDVALFDFVSLVQNRDNKDYIKGNLSYNKNHLIDTIIENLTTLKKIKKAEIIDKSYSKALEEQIIVFRRLIKKIH